MNYYLDKDYDELLSNNCQLNMVLSGRAKGKSSRIAIRAIQYCLDNHKKFAILTRNSLYKMPLYFQGFVNEEIQKKYNTTISFTDKGDNIIRNDTEEVIGYRHFLSLQHIYKSNQMPDIDIVLFEEFVTLDAGTYFENEYDMFMSYLSTVFRHRTDFKVFMIGNVLTSSNPYFLSMGIPSDVLTSYGCKKYRSGGTEICVQVCEPAYESMDEVPEYMRTKGNELQVLGIYEDKSPFVIKTTDNKIEKIINNAKDKIVINDTVFYLTKLKKGKNTYPFICRRDKQGIKPNPKDVAINRAVIRKLMSNRELTLYFDGDFTESLWKQTLNKYS